MTCISMSIAAMLQAMAAAFFKSSGKVFFAYTIGVKIDMTVRDKIVWDCIQSAQTRSSLQQYQL